MLAFNAMIFVSALIIMSALTEAQPVNPLVKNGDMAPDSQILVPKGRDAYLVMKAYNALLEAGKALETLIEMHEVAEQKTQAKRSGEGEWEFMRFGRK